MGGGGGDDVPRDQYGIPLNEDGDRIEFPHDGPEPYSDVVATCSHCKKENAIQFLGAIVEYGHYYCGACKKETAWLGRDLYVDWKAGKRPTEDMPVAYQEGSTSDGTCNCTIL